MLWQIGLGDSVNNITDAVIRAVYEDCHFEKKDLFFQQAEKVSPYIETAFTYLNTKHVNNKKIEVNVLCRYAEIFQELLHLHTTYRFLLYEKRKDTFNGRGIPYNIKDVIALSIYYVYQKANNFLPLCPALYTYKNDLSTLF